ncbi:MAG: peptidoglycan DD-metalloendopeptidase family protein [Clostridia bacterium]|nr:peptidoglycan DD-metalloendopeptidase family protein [Clostridia bacterium]
MFENIYNQIYYIGIQTMRYGKRFFKGLWALLLKPLKTIATLVFTLFILIDKFALKTFHEIVNEIKALIEDTKKVSDKLNQAKVEGNWFKKFVAYVKKANLRYRKAFVYVINFALPVLSLVILLNVATLCADTTFALEINYNDKTIGYVQNEEVYKEARELAFDRLDISAASSVVTDDGKESELIGEAKYKIKPVKLSQINDASEICDKLIENSDSKITNACGIYIDNQFVCAVKNETDALSVFDSILAKHETDEENAVVSFVENIEYVQGLYPDNENTVRDAAYLSEKLNSQKSEARYYTVQAGDTVSQIAQRFGMKPSQIFNLNPSLKENIYIGQQILLSNEVNFLRVQTTKTETRKVEIPYKTVEIKTDKLYIGDKKTITKGVNGVQEVTELVTYIDGVRVSTKEVSRTTISEPTDQKVQVGTKKNNYSSGAIVSGGGRLLWPTVGAYSISSGYGRRSFGDGWHAGIDIVRPGGSSGCTVVAAESGTVTYAGWYNSGGCTVMIKHANGLSTMYCHMKAGSIRVYSGQKVVRGQAIGQIGATGYVTGAHLHFEVKVNGRNVNPMNYLKR